MTDDTLEGQALKYWAEGEEDKKWQKPWHREIYRYTMPWRRRDGDQKQVNDQWELFDQTAQETNSDFASAMQATITPVDDDFVFLEPAPGLSQADAAQLLPELQAVQALVFSEIRRSNFDEASLESYYDLGAGTMGLCIQDLGVLTEPIHCQAVPITDLNLVRGTYGGVDFRGREITSMKLRDIPVSYPRAMLDSTMLTRVQNDPCGTVKAKECWWRLWDKPNYGERWQYVLLVDEKYADDGVFEGDGSCSLLTPRWKTDSTTAWGIGPLYTALPGIKSLDVLSKLVLEQLSFAVFPARTFDNDGIINVENGISPGDWIPRQPGSKIEEIGSDADFDTSFYSRKDMQTDIKRALFQDGPAQSGDTPPTLGQWMDEKAREARRMGAPFGRLKTEWQIAVFARFVYLLQRRGTIPKTFNIRSPKIRLRTTSPLIQAGRQQKVALAAQALQGAIATLGPQTVMTMVKGPETLAAMLQAIDDKIIVLNTPAEAQALVQAALQQAQAAAQPPQTPVIPQLPQGGTP